MNIGYHRDLELSIDAADARVRETLAAEGFGVLTEIDVQATLKEKLNVDFRPYRILGACHPPTAFRALSIKPEVGLLLPCNVTVSANDDGTVRVAAIDAEIMLKVVDSPELAEVAAEVNAALRRAVDAV
ncbi:MAG: DUF302 domain-containing protein [Candidatus Neomarinimicrobiota bacterium]